MDGLTYMLQMIMLEGANATMETLGALRIGAVVMKEIHKATYVAIYFIGRIHDFPIFLLFVI